MLQARKILIIQTAFLGDSILASSLLETLHDSLPSARLDLLLRSGNEGVYEKHPYLGQLYIWKKKKYKYRNLCSLLFKIRKEKYDIVLNLQRFFSTGVLTLLSGARISIGFNKNPLSFFFTKRVKHAFGTSSNPIHEIDRNHKLLLEYFKFPLRKPKLYPSPGHYNKVKSILEKYIDVKTLINKKVDSKLGHREKEKYICIVPASVWVTKQYPSEKWIELIEHLPEVPIFLLGANSNSEQKTCEEIIAKVKHDKVYSLCGELSILETAALMQGAFLNYVNDSAALHIASSINARVISIFCSTIPSFGFYPLSEKSKIVEVSQEKLPCRPCGLHGRKSCPMGHFDCAYKIEVGQLLPDVLI